MQLTNQIINKVRGGFKATFDRALKATAADFLQIAMKVPSEHASENYGWLGQFPGLREWIGSRVVNNLKEHGYAIVNKDFEATVAVKSNHIADDNLGIYKPMFEFMGDSAGNHPAKLCFDLLKSGFGSVCYDGQYFFDTDHPVLDAAGVEQSVSNTGGGSGPAWFLLDVSRPLKPIIYQERQPAQFVSLDKPDDEGNFYRKELVYGVDYRGNVGFGLWQMAYGSKQVLDATSFEAARKCLLSMTADYGAKLGLGTKLLLVVGPSNLAAGEKLLDAVNNAAGATNTYKGKAELFMSPYLD